jgi:farnesyl diphosphate synthase
MASSAVSIPLLVAAIATYPLAVGGAFTSFADIFFALTIQEQAAVLALVFSVIFAAVAITGVSATGSNDNSSSSSNNNNNKNVDIQYPLAEISQLTTEADKFKCVYPMLREDCLSELRDRHELKSEALEWIQGMMDYNVPGGKLNRGTTVLSVQSTLKGSPLTDLETCRAAVLGWAIEYLQAFFLVADDVMDESQTRRGQPCWYKKPQVHMIAINDSFLLESFVFTILKKHFGHETYYLRLIELFISVIQKTEVGQLLDLTSQPMGQPADLDRFTLERYQQIVKYKTAYYTFYLPVAMGMITSGVTSSNAFQTAERICCIMGEYFQIQDDYLDCYGKPEVIGKIGTDIQDNKCSWLVVQALQRATPAQRKILLDNYGKWDDKKVKRVKDLYLEMGMEKIFQDYEESSYADIQRELDSLTVMPRDVFELLLRKIYKRSK